MDYNQETERRKEKLKSIIVKGISEFTSYKELYNFLLEYHSKEVENSKREKYNLPDFNYFKNIFANRVKFQEDKTLYRFPLLYKINWLRSRNKKLWIKLNKLLNSCKDNDLLPLSIKFLKRFQISDFIDFLKNECKKSVWGQTTFDLYRIEESGNTLILHCCKGNYLHFVNTYELIQKELYYNCIYEENKFILRKKINFERLEDYSWRPAKMGINVFTIMKRKDGGHSTFIHKRKFDQVEYPGFYHVAPAGTFQPTSEHNIENQYSFGFTIFREFLEELFDLEKVDREYRELDPMKIFSLMVEHPERELSQICPGTLLFDNKPDFNKFKTTKYELIPTGFLIDITSFKPEITFTLFIKDEEIYEALSNYISGCWEADIEEYDLAGNRYNGNFFNFLDKTFTVNEFLPAGAVAVSEGIKYYMENLMKS